MKLIKKISLLALLTPAFALARTIGENTGDTDLAAFIGRVKDFLVVITSSLTALFIIIGGIKYMTSAGNPQRVEDAKKTLSYAIIGFVLFLLVNVVFALFQGPQFVNIFK